jgi:hypothetical protein
MMSAVDDRRARVEEALREAAVTVARMPETAGARELKGRLEGYRRALEAWDRGRPTDEQAEALLECIHEVRRIAVTNTPTVRRRSRKSSGTIKP